MPKWPVDKYILDVGDPDGHYDLSEIGKWAAGDIAERHNADIDALTAERDELQRRLDAVVGSLKPGDQPNYMDPKYNPSKMPPLTEYNLDCMLHGMRKQAHARAVAIAEGREG